MTNRLLIACFLTVVLKTAAAQTLALLPQNPHYFTYQGKPTVVVGSGEHYGAVMNLGFNYDKYLQTLQKEELNTTRLFTGAYYEKPGFWDSEKYLSTSRRPTDTALEKNNGKYELTAWNEAFFARLHDFMKKSAQSGVIVEICLFSAYYGAGWAYHPFNGNNNNNQTPTDLVPQKVNTLDNGAVLKFQKPIRASWYKNSINTTISILKSKTNLGPKEKIRFWFGTTLSLKKT
ncbi:MAG: hypothetical protein R2822_13820 [Spirosomataceae bacterium]